MLGVPVVGHQVMVLVLLLVQQVLAEQEERVHQVQEMQDVQEQQIEVEVVAADVRDHHQEELQEVVVDQVW
jgi:hypothetical protein|tara:strand:+ start:449 stop:661 length:213 start_codon:yes stop_codon:yes gene_type:complete